MLTESDIVTLKNFRYRLDSMVKKKLCIEIDHWFFDYNELETLLKSIDETLDNHK